MKKRIVFLLLMAVFIGGVLNAQIREIPAGVTDAFKSRYPHAENVAWKDKITSFEATFNLSGMDVTADFSSKGEWKSSEAKSNYDNLPAPVKDGFNKSKYSDWAKGPITEVQRMGKAVHYKIYVEKSQPFQKKFLYFNADGKLTKDAITL